MDHLGMIDRFREFNRNLAVRLGLLGRYRFEGSLTLIQARVILETGAVPDAGPGMTHSRLLRILRIDSGYLSRVVAGLAAAGLMKRTRSRGDGRSVELRLTPAGRAELAEIDRKSDAQAESLISHLSPEDRLQFSEHLVAAGGLLGKILPSGFELKWVSSPAWMPAFAELFREYAAGLGVDLAFQGFEEELATLPGHYAAPGGAMLLAMDGDNPVGCVALRPIDAESCEMKRLYVRKSWRGFGLGESMIMEALGKAAALGYSAMRLDTLARLSAACALYRRLGFREIPAYYENPLSGVVYFEKNLLL